MRFWYLSHRQTAGPVHPPAWAYPKGWGCVCVGGGGGAGDADYPSLQNHKSL